MSANTPTPDSRPTPHVTPVTPASPSSPLPSSVSTSPSAPTTQTPPALPAKPSTASPEAAKATAARAEPKAKRPAKPDADADTSPVLERLAESTWERMPLKELKEGIDALRERSADLSKKLRRAVVVQKRRERQEREALRLKVSAEIAALVASNQTPKAMELAKEHRALFKDGKGN